MASLTIAELVAQSSGLPHEGSSVVDHPKTATYDWGKAGWLPSAKPNSNTPPVGMTEISGYIHSYNIMGKPVVACRMLCRNMQTWVRSRSKGWLRVEDQNDPIKKVAGGHYVGDMSGGANPLVVTTVSADKSVSFASPPATRNCHWWLVARGQLPSDVDATVFMAEVMLDNPNANIIAGGGTDWWKVGGGWPGGNAAALCGSFVILKNQWRWVACTNLTDAQLKAAPLPMIAPPEPQPEPEPVPVFNTFTVGGHGKPGSEVVITWASVNAEGDWSAAIKVEQ